MSQLAASTAHCDAPAYRRSSSARRLMPDLVGLVVSCLVVVLAYWPVLLGGHTLSASAETPGTNGLSPFPGQPAFAYTADLRPDKGASSWALEPWAEVTHRAYANGELPLWNPYQAAGAPHAANMQSAVFDPLLLAVHLHPTPLTWDLSIIGAFLLGALAAYLFGRVLGLRPVPAIVTSAAFSLSGWFLLYNNNGFSRSYAYLPLLFLLVELVVRSRRLLPVLGLAVAIAGNLYVGMPEASLFVLGSTAIYALISVVQRRSQIPMRVSVPRLGVASVLGLLLAAPLVLLFLQYEPLSFNIHKPGDARGSEADPQWALLNWIVPFFPSADVGALVRSWFGAAVALSALAAISGREESKRLHAWQFAALAGVLLLTIYEFHVLDWIGRLPGLELVVFPRYAPTVVSFAVAVLAGIGVQVVWNRDLRVRRFLALLATGCAMLLAFVATGDRWDVITKPPRDYAEAVWSRAGLFALVALVAVIAGSAFRSRVGALLLTGAIVAELLVLAPSYYPKRADPYVAPGWLPLIREAMADEPEARVFAVDGKLYPNTAGALALQDVRALDALYVTRYLRYVRTFIAPNVFDRFTGMEEPIRFVDNPMFDAFAARTILSERDLSDVAALRLLGQDGDTRVYEKTDAYPRAWVVHDIHVVEREDDAFAYLESRGRRDRGGVVAVEEFDPRSEAVVEDGGGATEETLRALEEQRPCQSGEGDRATIAQYSGRTVTIDVTTACAGLLVLPDTYFPGWSATVNERPSRIYPTNGAFRGVIVPEGTSRVELRYQPQLFYVGIGLAIAGLAGFALFCLIVRSRMRRQPATTRSP